VEQFRKYELWDGAFQKYFTNSTFNNRVGTTPILVSDWTRILTGCRCKFFIRGMVVKYCGTQSILGFRNDEVGSIAFRESVSGPGASSASEEF
jgi:hypothetical protein